MPLPATVDAVFLDVGGPIYPDRTFVAAVTRALDDLLAERSEPPADRSQVHAIYDRIRERQNGSFRTALAQEILGDASARDRLHERTAGYWQHPAGSVYADVVPELRRLHGKVTIGILANQEAAVVDALHRDGVGQWITVWGVSGLVGHEKPSPELFRWALDRAGTTASRAVHVGNRLDTDVRPAATLGLATVWVLRGDAPDRPTPAQLAEPDAVLPGLSGLADLLLDRRDGRQ